MGPIQVEVQTFSTVEIEEDDYSWIFDDYDLSDEQKKEFLENHGEYMGEVWDYVSIDLTNEGDLSGDDYDGIKTVGIETLQGRLENFVKEVQNG